MSEDYKKIALEDVEKGQRIQIALYYATHVESYTGKVVNIDSAGEWIALGYDLYDYRVYLIDRNIPAIFLLEDVPKPKVVRTETVTITHYDDGTKTETPVKEVKAPTVIRTMDQFEEHEEYLKKTLLRDKNENYWEHTSGSWEPERTYVGMWLGKTYDVIEACLPMTIVETLGD